MSLTTVSVVDAVLPPLLLIDEAVTVTLPSARNVRSTVNASAPVTESK